MSLYSEDSNLSYAQKSLPLLSQQRSALKSDAMHDKKKQLKNNSYLYLQVQFQ